MVVRFQPSAPFGAKAGTITIVSDDPAGPHVVPVSGIVPAPKANLMIANTGSFGDVCVGSFADEPLIVTNSGKCTLSVTGISSTSGEFLVPEVLSYPITIGPGDALPVPIRFKPLSFGAKAATITVTSDDPASPISINVSGDAPSGKLTVTGSTTFGGVNAGCCADRTLSICNTGDCALERDQRALQAQEPALEAAQQSIPGDTAARARVFRSSFNTAPAKNVRALASW